MAWDFSTDAEYAASLEWAREFVRDEIWPLDAVSCELDEADLGRILRSLHQQVKEQGLWACHLPPELGGQGYGQVKLVPGYPFSSRSPSPKAALSPDACFTPSTPWTVTRAHFGAEPDTWARACSKPH